MNATKRLNRKKTKITQKSMKKKVVEENEIQITSDSL